MTDYLSGKDQWPNLTLCFLVFNLSVINYTKNRAMWRIVLFNPKNDKCACLSIAIKPENNLLFLNSVHYDDQLTYFTKRY